MVGTNVGSKGQGWVVMVPLGGIVWRGMACEEMVANMADMASTEAPMSLVGWY